MFSRDASARESKDDARRRAPLTSNASIFSMMIIVLFSSEHSIDFLGLRWDSEGISWERLSVSLKSLMSLLIWEANEVRLRPPRCLLGIIKQILANKKYLFQDRKTVGSLLIVLRILDNAFAAWDLDAFGTHLNGRHKKLWRKSKSSTDIFWHRPSNSGFEV